MKPYPRTSSKAFTLVEMLTVTFVIAILATIAIPSISGLSNEGNMNQAIGGISSLLEEARAYAMGHNTYVWVGFTPNATTQQLTVGVVGGNTGEITDLASSAYSPITPLHVYNYFSLASITGLTGMAANGDSITASQIGAFSQTGRGTMVTFTDVIQYSPQGVASVLANSSSHWIQIGLQPIRGSKTNDPNVAVFQVGALTGQVEVFRP
jgi:prepilin-type N-terminal cleavage/methylation domain-containing protein